MIAFAEKSLLPHLTTSDCVSQCFSLLFLKLAVTLLDTRTWQSVMVFYPSDMLCLSFLYGSDFV